MVREGWLDLVDRQLKCTSDQLSQAHRGAFALFPPDVHVLFGNRGDDEVFILRNVLPEVKTTILAYGESSKEESWAMIVRSPLDADTLSDLLWTAWHTAASDDPRAIAESKLQMRIANAVVRRFKPMPAWMN